MSAVSLESMMPLIEEAFARGQAVTIPVTGTSMKPLLHPKDAVTLRAINLQEIERGDILLYRRENGKYVLHRVVAVHEETVDFCGDNQVKVEVGVSKSRLIAQVTSYEKNGKVTALDVLRKEGCRRLRDRPVRFAATTWHSRSNADKPSKDKSAQSSRYIFAYVKRQAFSIVLMCIVSCISAGATLGMALASGRVIDKALGGDMHNFAQWFWILFGLLLTVAIANVIYSSLRIRAAGKLRNELRRDLFAKLVQKTYPALQQIHSGEILNRLTSDIQIVVDNAVTLIPQALSMAIKLIGGLSFMMLVEPVFTSVVIVVGLTLGALVQVFSRFYKAMHKQCQETEGKTRSYLQECIENMTVIKSFANEDSVIDKLDEYQAVNLEKQIKRNAFANVGNTTIYTGFTFAYYAGLAWGVLRIAGVIGTIPMSVGMFASMLQIMEQIRAPFRSASGLLPQLYSMLASSERLYELSALPEEERQECDTAALAKRFQSLVLDNISFAYENARPVLSHAAAEIRRGEFVVLVGTSGVGKTTLIKLLLGLVLPQEGQLLLKTEQGDVPVDASTRPLFSYVPQGNMLLSGTLRDNLIFGNRAVSQEQLDRAIKLACLQETVASLERGLDTVVGERGVGLSEGQLQRVAIARALLSTAPILLLDECTSALDVQTERQLLANLRSLRDHTVLFISHRTAVLNEADCILTVKDGMICRESK